ncbi:MAG: NfeD family protein [Candidatus Dormibacteria bacterium]
MVWFWVALGILLLAVEIYTTAFFAVFIAAGCFAAAAVSQMSGDVLPQVAVGGLVALAGALLARPLLVRVVERRVRGHFPGGVQGLVGQSALTADAVGDEHHPGHVLLGGERWLAVTEGPAALAADVPVTVVAVQGTTLLVRPRTSPVTAP